MYRVRVRVKVSVRVRFRVGIRGRVRVGVRHDKIRVRHDATAPALMNCSGQQPTEGEWLVEVLASLRHAPRPNPNSNPNPDLFIKGRVFANVCHTVGVGLGQGL